MDRFAFSIVGGVWGVTALILLIVAWRAAAALNIRLHRPLMILLVALAWVFLAAYLSRYSEHSRNYGPSSQELPSYLILWLAVHGTVALIPLFGATMLVWARLTGTGAGPGIRLHLNRNHRRYGRALAGLWLFTNAGGIFNFALFSLFL
jgi:uncharacterized membrane protein YozB (DUF420 family)